jgi:putative peptide zinc metalloprotease protein
VRSMDERTGLVNDSPGPSGPNVAHADAAPLTVSADRPSLAPATWLVGQLHESALENPLWAVERAKLGYIQMGELAYRVAEQANGEQTAEEIAAAVSEAVQRPVRVHDVQALIHTVLIPRGVLLDPSGTFPDAADDFGDADDGNSDDDLSHDLDAREARTGLLGGARRSGAASVRETVVGPAALEAAASVLMWYFWPPVMLVVSGLAVAELFWLFWLHGLAPAIIDVLTRPILLLPTLILALAVAAVQPLGRMVALYGYGGTIVRLRVARSLRYPALTVDVDNDYGLSRWARLIVNASGIYLQLTLALVICLVGVVTGAEFLFLSVALISCNVLRLLLPFGAPGADRLLADLLLVPHPLRYAGLALGRVVPGLSPSPADLPRLKRWGYIVLTAYLAVIALKLLFVGMALLWATPTVLATTAEAFFS